MGRKKSTKADQATLASTAFSAASHLWIEGRSVYVCVCGGRRAVLASGSLGS